MVVLGTIDADRPADDRPAGEAERGPGVAPRARWLLVVALAPLVVSAMRSSPGWRLPPHRRPGGHRAGGACAVGRHEVLTGLWSPELWAHPGPLSFYLLARRLLADRWRLHRPQPGSRSPSTALRWAAWRSSPCAAGGPLALCTLVACALVMRTLGADLVHEFQNIYIVTLPFGLMVFLDLGHDLP